MQTVAGLDIHKDSVFLCILQANGEKREKKYGVLTSELTMLREELVNNQVSEVGMESTSIYWIPIWRVLEGYVKQYLVNPYFIKQLPGRKSDVKDAAWIAECVQKQLIRGSYVPPTIIQQLRQYNRRIYDINAALTRHYHKLDALMQRCNIRLSNYLTNTGSKSYRCVVEALCQGISAPEKLITCVHGRILSKHGYDTILSALTGVFSETDVTMLSQLKADIDTGEKTKAICEQKMLDICRQHYPVQLTNLITIPGVKERAATSIIAEIGVDMTPFQTPNHLTSWCGLRPRNDQSNHTVICRKITHGNKFVRQIMIECAWAASRQTGCFFNKFSFTQTQVRKKPQKKVMVAIARKMLVCVWHILTDNVPYMDSCNQCSD